MRQFRRTRCLHNNLGNLLIQELEDVKPDACLSYPEGYEGIESDEIDASESTGIDETTSNGVEGADPNSSSTFGFTALALMLVVA
jgi:hypothetical protein